MAKKKQEKEKSIEEALWQSANKLRGSVESAEYKHVVLGLIFLKFASDKFEVRRAELIEEGKEKYLEMAAFYNEKNVFFLEPSSRWSFIIDNAKQDDIAIKIDTALHQIEKANPSLKGALPDNYFSRLQLDKSKLGALLDTINKIDTQKDEATDIVGRVYEYFLSKFALAEGKGKGEFYTPKSIVNLIAEMIEPYEGIIYDPACGSGGMFVQSIKFIENHNGNKKNISIYGQEYTNTTYKLAKMNLAIRGIAGNLGAVAADTFARDQHPDLKADYIMANPPFNQKDWRAANELTDDPRWQGYETPPKSNANYAWILNMVAKLSDQGVAGFILANGALSGGGEEYKIRKKLIENNLVEAIVILPQNMFYTTNISVTLWIINKNKKAHTRTIGDVERKYRFRESEVLFLDLRQRGIPFEKKFIQFSDENITEITDAYHNWQQVDGNYQDVPEFCASVTNEEIEKKDFSLVPSKYIEFINRDEQVDYHDRMEELKTTVKTLMQEKEQNDTALAAVFKKMGYEI